MSIAYCLSNYTFAQILNQNDDTPFQRTGTGSQAVA